MERSSGASDSIADSNRSAPDRVLLTHSSDHEIHTPQHRSHYHKPASPRFFADLQEDQVKNF